MPSAAFGAPPNFGFSALNSLTAADFDDDGKLDIAVELGALATPPSATQFTTVVLSGQGNGAFSKAQESFGLLNAAAADINRDGIPDLVGYSYENGFFVRLGNGDGTFQPDVLIGPEHAGIFNVTDLNRDGTPDIAVVGTTGITSFLNLSAPEPALTVVSAASFAAGPLAPNSFAAAFGEQLSPASSAAFTVVIVRDSTGVTRTAQIYYASPGQVNFLIPAATAPGPATVTVGQVPFGKTFSATVQIVPLAPAIFSGASLQLDSYLVLFGTGFDAAHGSQHHRDDSGNRSGGDLRRCTAHPPRPRSDQSADSAIAHRNRIGNGRHIRCRSNRKADYGNDPVRRRDARTPA